MRPAARMLLAGGLPDSYRLHLQGEPKQRVRVSLKHCQAHTMRPDVVLQLLPQKKPQELIKDITPAI